jgi:hypothetical protein
MGAQMLREVASKTSDVAGDGTTTATVLAQAIVREGAKSVAAGANPMDLKRGIDLALVAVLAVVRDRLHCSGPSGHRLFLLREWRLGAFRDHGLVSTTLASRGCLLC